MKILNIATAGLASHLFSPSCLALPSASTNISDHVLDLKSQNISLAVPIIPDLELDFQFDASSLFRPLEIYMTAIHLMVQLARRPWESTLFAMVADNINGFKVVVMILNPRQPTEPKQLEICHCVVALYRAVVIMTDGVLFCKMRAIIKLGGSYELGALSFSPIDTVDGSVNQTKRDSLSSRNKSTVDGLYGAVKMDRGRVVDPENFLFVIEYLWYGKSIRNKDISLAILGAIATAAPHELLSHCETLEAVSPEGDCVVIVDRVDTAGTKLTYFEVVRALELAYDQIFVAQKRWGDLLLILKYDDRIVGEVRVLRGVVKDSGMAEA